MQRSITSNSETVNHTQRVSTNFIHDCATSSHPGKEKAYKQAQLKYYWTDMRKQIYSHIDNCNICAKVKEVERDLRERDRVKVERLKGGRRAH